MATVATSCIREIGNRRLTLSLAGSGMRIPLRGRITMAEWGRLPDERRVWEPLPTPRRSTNDSFLISGELN